jgi:transglutaminase-like putative cysteine protease
MRFRRQRSSAVPSSPSEDSVLLRTLVQGLVTVGICALAIAASGVTDTSSWNLLAIPFSAVGASWSWRSRRRKNIGVKFCIALGMLLALAFFFWRLLNLPGDTRIILAELLIQLQVLHSFDLPRRKDLGYSMMIGLILVGVAATISQTLVFGLLLFLFLLIALPVLTLDYRSRLGLRDRGWHSIRSSTAPRQLGGVLLITLLLGLIIFAALPRLPGYQLRTFPVSGSVDTDSDFDGRTIFNPGYINGGSGDQDAEAGNGDGSGGPNRGQSPEEGPGRMSTDFYYGFNQRMNQNLRGEMISQVVMRVRSQSQGFWRVMAFDRYTGQGWEISRNDATSRIPRSPISYQFLPPRMPRLGPRQEVVQTYTMVQDFQNLLPVLYQPKEIYFPSQDLVVDPEGAFRSPKPLTEGLTYTVVSDVALRIPEALQQATQSYPLEIANYYLQIPASIQPRVQAETERLLKTSPVALPTVFDKVQFLTQAIKDRYALQEDLPFFEDGEDLVEAFLFKYQGGTPDHFSTVLTMMLRSIGVPARLVAGFGTGDFNPFTGFYIVRNTDAYAITEVFFPEYGWFTFDPIPGHLPLPPSVEDYDPFGILRQLWQWLEGLLPPVVAEKLQQGFQLLAQLIYAVVSVITRFSSQGWLSVLGGVIGLTGLSFVGWLGWQGWRSWQRCRWLNQLPPMERLYQQMLYRLSNLGYPKAASQTPFEYSDYLRQEPTFHQAPLVQTVIQAYVRWRYGDEDPADIKQLQANLKHLKKNTPPSAP